MSAEDDPTQRRFSLLGLVTCIVLFVGTCAVYLPASKLDFILFDDPNYVIHNKHLAYGFTGRGLTWAFTSFDPDNWFPLTRLSHMLDYALFGLQAQYHHDVNILIHALAVLMLFAFLRRSTRQIWPSAFVAAVFAVHPLHVESVAWVAERKDVLCALFWFTTLWAWVRYTERPSKIRYVLALLAFAAGLMSKPMIVTLPLLLPFIDRWPLRQPLSRKRILLLAPFLVLSAADAVLTVLAQRSVGFVHSFDEFPLAARVMNVLTTLFVYIGKTFWPTGLSVPYPWPASQSIWLAVAAALGITGISALVLTMRRERPWMATGWFWFLITLLPVIGIVQVGQQSRADRYMYVPMTGLLIVVAWGGAEIGERIRLRWPRIAYVTPAIAGAACLSLATLTWAQQQYWQSADILFRHAILLNDRNYLAWQDLALVQNTSIEDRVECYRMAAGIRPDLPELRVELGRARLQGGYTNDAIADFETALRIHPGVTRTRCLLGIALLNADRYDDAISQFERAIREDPNSAMAHDDLAVALWRALKHDGATNRTVRVEDVIKQMESAIALRPDNPMAKTNLGLVLVASPGGAPEAHRYFIEVLGNDPEDVPAHLGLAETLTMAPFSDPAAAASHLATARTLEPDPALLAQLESPRMDDGQTR